MSLHPEPSTTWSSTVERGSSHVGRSARVAQGSLSDFSASLLHEMTHSRENPGPLLKPELHRWHLQIVSVTCQTPCACGTDLSYRTFSSTIGGFMQKPPKFFAGLVAQRLSFQCLAQSLKATGGQLQPKAARISPGHCS
jgi:hypothetical protein